MSTPKISHLVCVFPPYRGGMGSVVKKQAQLSSNYQIEILTPNYQKKEDEIVRKDNFVIIRKKPKFSLGNSAYINISHEIKNTDILQIHYPFYFSMLPAIRQAKKLHKKVIIFWHMNPQAQGLKGLFFKFYEKNITPWIFRQANLILVSTSDYFEHSPYQKLFQENKNKIQELAFSVDPEIFQSRKPSPELLKKYNLKNLSTGTSGKKILLFVGGLDRAHYFKGLEIIFLALKKLSKDYILIVIGDGDLRKNYEKTARKMDLLKRIIFAGKVSNKKLPEYYNLCHALILASLNQGEAFGLVQLEAMASAKPVIASNLPGVRKVLKDQETGFVFETGNASDLKNKIEKLFAVPDRWEKFCLNARQRILENYSDSIIAEKLNEIYQKINYENLSN